MPQNSPISQHGEGASNCESSPVVRATVMILVHGTFARGAGWATPNSTLRDMVTEGLRGEVKFKAFKWSGANSHRARVSAAKRFARFLQRSLRADADALHVIVAHSHGGMVALYALRDTSIERQIAGLICMATPFITTQPREWRLPFKESPRSLHLVVAAATIATLCALYLDALRLGTAAAILLGSLALIPVVGMAVFKASDWFDTGGERVEKQLHLEDCDQHKTFVISVTGDEALWWLRRLMRWSEAPFIMFEVACWIMFHAIWITPLLFLLPGGALSRFEYLIAMLFGLGTLLVTIPLLVAMMLFIPPVLRGKAVGFGGEAVLDNIVARTTPSRFPNGRSGYYLPNYYRCKMGLTRPLRHCRVYDDPAALSMIVRWATRLMRQAG